ncbi:PDZ domain-containing protein [Thermodesulfobacteriota bacterium]
MKILRKKFFRKLIFINLLYFGVLNLFIAVDSLSRADDIYDLSGECYQMLYCQNESVDTPRTSTIKDSLGIEIRPVIPADVERYGLNSLHGVVIVSFHPASPLTRIGFEEKDVVLEVNGKDIKGKDDFLTMLNELKPQQRITIRALDHRTGKIGYVQLIIP